MSDVLQGLVCELVNTWDARCPVDCVATAEALEPIIERLRERVLAELAKAYSASPHSYYLRPETIEDDE